MSKIKKSRSTSQLCVQCRRLLPNAIAYKAHIESHALNNTLNFQCATCNISFVDATAFDLHKNVCAPKKRQRQRDVQVMCQQCHGTSACGTSRTAQNSCTHRNNPPSKVLTTRKTTISKTRICSRLYVGRTKNPTDTVTEFSPSCSKMLVKEPVNVKKLVIPSQRIIIVKHNPHDVFRMAAQRMSAVGAKRMSLYRIRTPNTPSTSEVCGVLKKPSGGNLLRDNGEEHSVCQHCGEIMDQSGTLRDHILKVVLFACSYYDCCI
jgi:hypothetical protein